MANYNEIPTLEAKIKDLERRMATAETAPRLTASSVGSGGLNIVDGGSLRIKDGGTLEVSGLTTLSNTLTVANAGDIVVRGGKIRVQDSEGEDRVRMGLLENGDYGVEQRVGNNWIPLHQIASGVTSSGTTTASFGFSAPANGSSGWVDHHVAPNYGLEFTTYTGRVTIITTADLTWYGNKSSAYLGYIVRRPNGSVVIPAAASKSSRASNNTGVDQSQSFVYIETFTVDPGTYQVGEMFMLNSGVTEASWVTVFGRTMMVLPF